MFAFGMMDGDQANKPDNQRSFIFRMDAYKCDII